VSGHAFHRSILREYDIRGVVGQTLFPKDSGAIGRAYGTIARRAGAAGPVCVGRDGRLSSPELHGALVEGLRASGVDVIDVGFGPTPMLYFAVYETGAAGGVMVTGSHNPPEHNGFKMMLGHESFFGDRIRELGAVAAAGDFTSGRGGLTSRSVMGAYVVRLAQEYPASARGLAVGWDAGNGAMGEAMAALTARLPGRHVLLNATIDGRFPSHHPDPTVPENLAELIAAVRRDRLDLGIAFDGDGDRIGVVDGEGTILWGDQLLALLARDVLARHPGATIIADVKASQTLFDEVARLGGRPLMWRTGHSLIKSKMAETRAPLAGEMSGHIFFADGYYGFDDALFAAVRLLRTVIAEGTSLSDLRRSLPTAVNTPELRFECGEERKFTLVDEVARRLAARGADVITVDGVRVRTADGWWLLRASNTQAIVVARCEAFDTAALDRVKAALAAELEASGFPVGDF